MTLAFGALGILLPLFILAVDWATSGRYPAWSIYVWPTLLMLMPYGGADFDLEKIAVTAVSVVLNGALYAVVGLVIGAVLEKRAEQRGRA